MKKLLSALLAGMLVLSGCSSAPAKTTDGDNARDAAAIETNASSQPAETDEPTAGQETLEVNDAVQDAIVADPNFARMNDPELLSYVKDRVYESLEASFTSEDYIIEDVKATYASKEYLEEVEYNSRSNVFFGYTLSELDQQFEGTRYVFTLGDNGETVVKAFEGYDNTYEKAIKNVAIGTGVILISVTVSAIAWETGFVPIALVFAASAETATDFALFSGAIGGISAGIVEGIQTQDFDSALKAAALGASEGFKWGAISGAVIGGGSEAFVIHKALKALEGATEYAPGSVEIASNLPLWRQAELRALNEYGGYEQLTYLDGKLVDFGTRGATRPDIVRNLGDHIEAIEVKYYNLADRGSLNELYSEVAREVGERVVHLPAGSTQRIVLDVTDRGFSQAICDNAVNGIRNALRDIYPNIPIEIVGLA